MKICLIALFLASSVSAAAAQQTDGTLRVTVVDPTGALIVGATVTVSETEGNTRTAAAATVKTSETGIATIPGLAPGRYDVQAEFPGFDAKVLKDIRVRSGDNKQVAVLPLSKLETSVTVAEDKQRSAADPRGVTFGTTLTREQIEALSDDPATLQRQLEDMAGPGAVIRIDGFEGGALPAKAQIRSIRISRDQFAAEFHNAGGVSIEVITQPGLGPIRYFLNANNRTAGLSGRSPFVPVRGPEANRSFGFGVGGGLIKEKSSFNLNVFGTDAFDTPNLNVALPGGTRSEALPIKSPRDNLFVNGQIDYALTLDQTLRVGYNLSRFTNDNLGVGGFDQIERAYSTENTTQNVRIQHFGPVGRRAFSRTRLQFFAADTKNDSATETETIRVNDAFNSGGAQLAGGDRSFRVNLASDLDYVRGRHSLRTGIQLDGGTYRSDASSNYIGTYTFDNLDAYEEGRPSNYTRRIGDPNLHYRMFQAAIYVQDDIRPRKNLTLSPGLRYEVQNHVRHSGNFGPRFGITWAPTRSGQTTLRTSAGIFYDWLANSTYEQVQRVDGFRQRELNILNPTFPDPGDVGDTVPVNRYLLGTAYELPKIGRISAGVDQTLFKEFRISSTYSYLRGSRLARGLNLNAPVDGIRPDPSFRNVVDVVSGASSRQHQLQTDVTVHPGALLPAGAKAPRISFNRTTLFLNYTLARLRNNTDGPFVIPATVDLETGEWGPAANDVRHRFNASLNNQIVRNLLISCNVNANTGDAYNLLTGHDDDGNGVFNDRPAGIGRNTLRTKGQATLNVFTAYQFQFGRTAPLPPGIGVFGGGGTAAVRTFDQGTAKYRLQVFVQMRNLTNTRNYVGYSGTQTSPFFGKPTAVREMRKIEVGFGLNF